MGDLSKRQVQQSVSQIVWCLCIAGYHKRYASFAALLDYAFFTDRSTQRPTDVRRLAQIADVVLMEAPAQAHGVQDPDRVASTRTDPMVRRLISSEPASDPQLLQDIRQCLSALNWSHEIFVAPDSTSAFLVDISLQAHFGEKV